MLIWESLIDLICPRHSYVEITVVGAVVIIFITVTLLYILFSETFSMIYVQCG